jgi:hypothetical protein
LTLDSPSSEFALAVRAMSRSLLGLDGRAAGLTDAAAHDGTRGGLVHTVRGLATGWLPSQGGRPSADPMEKPT